jgi:RNA polymerase sigma-70 factor (TIGR02943 family)
MIWLHRTDRSCKLEPVFGLSILACTMTQPSLPTYEQQLVSHHDYLMRFARLQLRNEAWAEDAVSDTVLAALAKPQAFENRSQLKTWLVGILKHKVIDMLRLHGREVATHTDDDDGADLLNLIGFKPDGHFAQMPADWGNPEQDLRSQQFLKVMDACVEKMPATQGRLFLMREWLELSVDDICKELGLTATNLYVQLHRGRLRLRECLELNWFATPKRL